MGNAAWKQLKSWQTRGSYTDNLIITEREYNYQVSTKIRIIRMTTSGENGENYSMSLISKQQAWKITRMLSCCKINREALKTRTFRTVSTPMPSIGAASPFSETGSDISFFLFYFSTVSIDRIFLSRRRRVTTSAFGAWEGSDFSRVSEFYMVSDFYLSGGRVPPNRAATSIQSSFPRQSFQVSAFSMKAGYPSLLIKSRNSRLLLSL